MFEIECQCSFSGVWREIEPTGEYEVLADAINAATRRHWTTGRKPHRVVDDAGSVRFQIPQHIPVAAPRRGGRPCGCH